MTEFTFADIHDTAQPLKIQPRERLKDSPNVAVHIGDAPDGLPLILHVVRRGSVQSAVMSALGNPGELSPSVTLALAQLEKAIARDTPKETFEQLGSQTLYKSKSPLGGLFGGTLLARALGSRSPLPPAEAGTAAATEEEPVETQTNPVALGGGADAEAVAAKRHLVVPATDGPVFASKLTGGTVDRGSLEALRFEDLRGASSAQFWSEEGTSGALADASQYRQLLTNTPRVGWTVSLSDLTSALLQIAGALGPLHAAEHVHCDIKMSNSVVTAVGAVAIDPIDTPAGQLAAGATPGWAAPEQQLGKPVSPASDVYALGLMLARLLRATLHGEERCYVVPAGKGSWKRVRPLIEPEIFIDPTETPMGGDARNLYTMLVRSCLAFEPAHRPKDAVTFAEQLKLLHDNEPIPGHIAIQPGPGQLYRQVDIGGAVQPGWVIHDRH